MSHRESSNSLLLVIVVAVIIAFTIALALFLVNYTNLHSKPSIKRVNELLEKGSPNEAIKVLDTFDDATRGSSQTLLEYGKSWYLVAWKEQVDSSWREYASDINDWFNSPSVEKSLHYLKKAQEDSTTLADATFYIALIYMQKGWYDKSESEFNYLFKIDPTHREGILNYAVLKSRQSHYDQAVIILERGITEYPKFAEYYKNIFWIYSTHLKNPELAIKFGDRYTKLAKRGAPGVIKVNEELVDLLARFPEYKSDTLKIVKQMGKPFLPRK